MRRIKHTPVWWRKGRHSNIPRCCCLWFCTVWIRIPGSLCREISYWQMNRDEERGRRWPRQAYTRCPVCYLRGRWELLHMCTEQCLSLGLPGNCYRPNKTPIGR